MGHPATGLDSLALWHNVDIAMEADLAIDASTAFFSYSRDDSGFALRLAEDLRAAGASIWLDQLDIEPGQRWDSSVSDALTYCSRLIVILSPAAVASAHVRDELNFALDHNKRVIPIVYRGCKIPLRLRQVQYVDFTGNYAEALRGLVGALAMKLPSSTPVGRTEERSPTRGHIPTKDSRAEATRAAQADREPRQPVDATVPLHKRTAVKVFCSYSHEDEKLKKRLEQHLSPLVRQKIVEVWSDLRIDPGQDWEGEIGRNLDAADMVLLLVSPSFISSGYCWGKELRRALERHEKGECLVVPIILRPVDWASAPFAKLQVLPPRGQPIVMWDNRDQACFVVAEGIRKLVENLVASAAVAPIQAG